MTKSAVLFLVFNRPDQTARTFAAIRRARPARLYVAADGPRPGHIDDVERCDKVRQIATGVDWPCELHLLLRDENLGCKRAVSGAIDWLFSTETEAIIVEDDCCPSDSFFGYCDELLEHYRDDTRIMSICGSNTLPPVEDGPSYFFSRHCRVWGWATWRRAWRLYDIDMVNWPEFRDKGALRAWADPDEDFEAYWTGVMTRTHAGKIDTWDYQWMFACWANSGLACRPNINMVSNIGFGADATHTRNPNSDQANAPAREIELPLRHPPVVLRDIQADRATQIRQFPSTRDMQSRTRRAFRKAIRILTKQRKIRSSAC